MVLDNICVDPFLRASPAYVPRERAWTFGWNASERLVGLEKMVSKRDKKE